MSHAREGIGYWARVAAASVPLGAMLAVLCGAALPAAAQTLDVERIGQSVGAGARAMGMGGAFVALADDATAVSWNPAGPNDLQKPTVSVGYGPWSRIRWEHPARVVAPWQVASYAETASSRFFEHASAALPFKVGAVRLVALAGYQRGVDMGWERDFTHNYGPEATSSALPNVISYSSNEAGGLDVWSAGLGLRLGRFVSLGVAVDRWSGDALSKSNERDEAGESVLWTQQNVDQSLSGTGARVGLILAPNRKLRVGAVVRAPFTMSHRLTSTSVFDGGMHSTDEELVKDGSFEWPLAGTLGVAYRPIERLTVAADVSLSRWDGVIFDHNFTFSITTRRPGEQDEHTEISGERRQTWPLFGDPDQADGAGQQSDTMQSRLGIEYEVRIRERITLPVRVGGFLDRQMERDGFGDPVRRTGATAGFGVRVPHATFDLAWVYEGGRTAFKAPTQDLKQGSHRLLVSVTLSQ